MAEECVFCRIAHSPDVPHLVYADELTVAFMDLRQFNPGHTLVIPKKHFVTLLDMPEREVGKLFESTRIVAMAVKNGTNADGLSLVQSNGKAAGQVVTHVHVHLIPRFMSEGPVSLEGVLSSKKMTDGMLDKIASAIKEKAKPHRESSEMKFDF